MASLGFAADSAYRGPIELGGDVKGASVLVLGAGLAGMTAALELRRAGYKVQVLEFNSRAGGRNWTLRGGDKYTELGGFTQTCAFERGLYLIRDRGGSRITIARSLITATPECCARAFRRTQSQCAAAFVGQRSAAGRNVSVRSRRIFRARSPNLLSKATAQGKLDEAVSAEDKEILLQALRSWGALDQNYAYKANLISAEVRGYAKGPGGGLGAAPLPANRSICRRF